MSVSLKIDSSDLSITDIFNDFYSVPDFQREYVWQEANIQKLLEDIYDEFYDEAGNLVEGPEYFLGSIVVCRGEDGTYKLIDGQQRMTTIFLVFCVIRDILIELEQQPPDALKNKISAASMDPRTGEDVHRYRLTLQYEDSAGVLEKIVAGEVKVKDIDATTKSVENIINAYQSIHAFMATALENNPQKIKSFLAAFTLRVKMIRIITPDLAHALKVFETINDRGVGLNAMDLLKNLLFMKTPGGQYQKLKDKWKNLIDILDSCGEKPMRFLRYFIMSHYDIDTQKGLREDEIYGWFQKNADLCGINDNPLAFVDLLVERSGAYANFLQAKDVSGVPNRYLSNIVFLSGATRQHFILLLAGQHLPSEIFSQLCKHIENLLFCYFITREQGKVFERNFTRWARELRMVKSSSDLDSFVDKYFKPELMSRSNNFDFAFLNLTQSKIQKYRMRYILAKLTQYIEEQAWGNPSHSQLELYLDGSVNIEHILPQSPTMEVRTNFDKPDEYDEYVVKLGNLTLLENTINASISNEAFERKKAGYRHSQYLLTSSLVERPQVGKNTRLNRAVESLMQFDKWDSQAIEKRQEMLTMLARRVWCLPD